MANDYPICERCGQRHKVCEPSAGEDAGLAFEPTLRKPLVRIRKWSRNPTLVGSAYIESETGDVFIGLLAPQIGSQQQFVKDGARVETPKVDYVFEDKSKEDE